MVTVRKTDCTARICVDFKATNSVTKPTPFYMPRVEEVLESVGKSRVISKLHTTTQLLQSSSGVRAKIWSNYTQDKTFILQHSYSHTSVVLEPKFGQIIHMTKPTYYNTATPRHQCSYSQNLVKLYTRQSLHTTSQLLPYFSGARAKIWSNYTQHKAYILQHSYSHTSVELEPKFGQIIHKAKPTYHITAYPTLQ